MQHSITTFFLTKFGAVFEFFQLQKYVELQYTHTWACITLVVYAPLIIPSSVIDSCDDMEIRLAASLMSGTAVRISCNCQSHFNLVCFYRIS